MRMQHVLAGLAMGAALAGPASAQRTTIEFWHGLTQPLGGMLEQIATDFNASQTQYQVNASFRGSYPETMAAAIAAFRAGQAPHVVQMFEVGTGTMIAAGRAIRPLHELLAETRTEIPFNDYLPAVKGYYSLPDGRMMSMPFNSSTAIAFYNKEHFRRAGLNPDVPPATWPEVVEAARKLKAAGLSCPFTTAWPTWTQIEQVSAIHNLPLATQENGFTGLNAELRINNPVMVKHLDTLIAMAKEGTYKWGGRDGAGDALFASGECSMVHASSGARARFLREVPGGAANVGAAMLPYYPDVAGAPFNSIIGGASFWVLNRGPNAQRTPAENQAIAAFFAHLAKPEVGLKWHTETGFLPVRIASYEMAKAANFYAQNPGADIPIQQLLRGGGEMTGNTRGIRLGGFVEIRVIMQEEMERALQGNQTGQQALDNAVTRGNQVLRNFERANRS